VSSLGRRLGVDSASLPDGTGEVLNAFVECHPIVQFQVSLVVCPISAPEIGAIWWVMKPRASRSVNEYREVIRA
jgi:hypothetical protein